MTRVVVCAIAVVALAATPPQRSASTAPDLPRAAALTAQSRTGRTAIAARTNSQRRAWDRRLDAMSRDGELRRRSRRDDALVRDRVHERFDQYHKGVRVFGGDVARQLDRGATVSVFGTIFEGIDVDTTTEIDEDTALAVVERTAGVTLGPGRRPELVVLPLKNGTYLLAWRIRAASRGDIRQYFVDARTGAIVFDYSDRQTQAAVGTALGVLGDTKKISVRPTSGRFVAVDMLRPPTIKTYDMQGSLSRTEAFLNGSLFLGQADLASDSDNDWSDGAVNDAHIYAGWTYDYFYRRFERAGLDNRDIEIWSLVHPVRRSDFPVLYDDYEDYFTNAFYAGDGIMVYGVGLPSGLTAGGQVWDYMSGALDIVAHELTHGVTDYSSGLIYLDESGALNEAFSDIMATSVEFFWQPPGSGTLRADYLIAEDAVRPGGLRSMQNPAVFGDPDHYSKRVLDEEDNGGVHTNSSIANHAFYLAIEGGTNRTSGLAVQGVGGANRAQIEKVFYRAFTEMLPASATFSTARAATIQAAIDLYGAGSTVERAITQAWDAVGVF